MARRFALTWWTQISSSTTLRVGRLVKAHGLKGAFKLELYTDSPKLRFVEGATLKLQVPDSSPWFGKTVTVQELRWYNTMPVLFLKECEDRTIADSLVKAILLVDAPNDEVTNEEHAWFDHQLVGLSVIRDAEEIGKVVRVDHLPSQDLLAIETATGEVLVPFVKAIVPVVDIKNRSLTITPPLGLFEEVLDTNEEA
ncbi:MAG: ribosome maturation factor RimM [Rhodoluna sp.]|nr:ribosome maturation factor RimM [Rhodoluna sp.]